MKLVDRDRHSPAIDVQTTAIQLTGVDLTAVDGLSAALIQTILSENGTDTSKWPTVKHFASWSGLAPHNAISGGKVLHSQTLPTTNRAGQAFRQAANTLARSPNAFEVYCTRSVLQKKPWRMASE
jgi:transposase